MKQPQTLLELLDRVHPNRMLEVQKSPLICEALRYLDAEYSTNAGTYMIFGLNADGVRLRRDLRA